MSLSDGTSTQGSAMFSNTLSPMQKMAWFNLSVIALTGAAYLTLFAFIGTAGSGGALGLLGLLGFDNLFFVSKKGRVLLDERDREISRNSVLSAGVVFWLYYVATGTIIPFKLDFGPVPFYIWESVFISGIVLALASHAVAILVFSRVYSEKSDSIVDKIRNPEAVPAGALVQFLMYLFVFGTILYFFPKAGDSIVEKIIGVTFCLTIAVMFWQMKKMTVIMACEGKDKEIYRKAGKISTLVLGSALAAVCLVLAALHASGMFPNLTLNQFLYVVFCSLAGGLLNMPVTAYIIYRREKKLNQKKGIRADSPTSLSGERE
jgi:hypothetical protein